MTIHAPIEGPEDTRTEWWAEFRAHHRTMTWREWVRALVHSVRR